MAAIILLPVSVHLKEDGLASSKVSVEVFAFIGVLSGHISDITLDYIIGNISFYKFIVTHDCFIC